MATYKIEGKDLIVTPASLAEAFRLQKAVSDALRKNGIDLSGVDMEGEKGPEIKEDKIGGIVELILSVATSPDVQASLFQCSERAVFGPEKTKVDFDFFEDVNNRPYYYPIMAYVIKENIGPFFKRLGSLFGMFQSLTENIQKSK